jgi:hypothetical protein
MIAEQMCASESANWKNSISVRFLWSYVVIFNIINWHKLATFNYAQHILTGNCVVYKYTTCTFMESNIIF